jgi:hypothetical protein
MKPLLKKLKKFLKNDPVRGRFSGHYVKWRAKRISAILDHYGSSFFFDKSLLEVGAGYGDIGNVFSQLGANVTCSDARTEHLQVIRGKYPHIKCVTADLEDNWHLGHHQIIIHMGVLYHLKDYKEPLKQACKNCDHLVLETEVVDSSDPKFVLKADEYGYDQAFGGHGIRPTAEAIEEILLESGMTFSRITDDRCNWDFHTYDWVVKNTKTLKHGQRRFWFAKKV